MGCGIALIILLAIAVIVAVAWNKNYLNSYVPAQWQHTGFQSGSALYGPTAPCNMVASTLNPNASCFTCGDSTFYNACGH